MAEQQYPKPRETSFTDNSAVFEDEKGYFVNREVTTETWNAYLRQYEKSGTRIEKVRMSELKLFKRAEQEIYIIKRIQSNEKLTDEDTYFSCTLVWEFDPNDPRYKAWFFYTCKRSGEVYINQMDSGVCGSAGVNGVFVKRTKIHKLEPDTRLNPKIPTFVINPTTNELERKLKDPY